MLDQIVGVFMPRVGELLVDGAYENIKDHMFTLESLEMNLRTLSAKASDYEKEVHNAEISGKRKVKREVKEWLIAVNSIETEFSRLENEVESQGFISRFFGGGRAAQMNDRVNDLIEQSRHFGDLLLDVCENMGEVLLTTGMIGNAFEENLERIWRLLSFEKVSILGIHGMGGVGKTTLAKHVNNRLLEQSEERVIWLTVSQAFTIRKLQDEIARAVHMDLSDEENEDKRAARLWRALSGRKNILILDDVWEKINLEKVGFPLSKEGFRLIITTRSKVVCRQIGCKEEVAVRTLPKDEAWKLFSEKLGDETRLIPEVEEIAKSMVEMCDGLPLGIVVLAGGMKGETALHAWRNALEELKEYSVVGRDDMEDEVLRVLQYSFDRLNRNCVRQGQIFNVEQLCFLYCSLYPEDYEIPKKELVGKFISKGLMDEKKERRKQVDKGNCILDKLVDVCLLESCGRQYEKVKMHDLVRYMALNITKGTTMVKAGKYSLKEIANEKEWTKDLETVSLMRTGIRQIPSRMSPNCPKLSTLLFSNNRLKFLPDSFFSKLHGLCTLDLSKTLIEKLPDSLSVLKRLEVLLLRRCYNLVYVPYLGNLKALRELDLSGTAIKELPSGIEVLSDIKSLSIDSQNLERFPSGLLLRFPNLQCLILPNHLESPIEDVKKLEQLDEFWGTVKNVGDANQFIRSTRVYDIDVGTASCFTDEEYRTAWPAYDHRVRFKRCDLENIEGKDEALLGRDLEALAIMDCEGLSDIFLDDFRGWIGNPKCIRSLRIERCGGIECILKGEQLMKESPQDQQSPVFSTLEQIQLGGLGDLEGIIILEKGETISLTPSRPALFSSLRELVIYRCNKMKNLGLVVSEFPILEHLRIRQCLEMEEIFVEVGTGEGEARLVYLPRLRTLHLLSLPKLKSICSKPTTSCALIQIIRLSRCPELKKFPLHIVPPPPSLTTIRISKEVWESMEWEDPSHHLLLQPFLRFLT